MNFNSDLHVDFNRWSFLGGDDGENPDDNDDAGSDQDFAG